MDQQEFDQTDEEFDAGFEQDTTAGREEDVQPELPSDNAGGEEAQPESAPEPQQIPEQRPVDQTVQTEAQIRRIAEVPQAIADELEKLRGLNQSAYELALEDSAEGQALRRRLENFGADQAQDRAEMVLYKRAQEQAQSQARQQAENARRQADLDAFRRGSPEFYDLMNNQARAAEREKYLGDVRNWIAAKSYREGSELMRVYQTGSPEQVCAMIDRFEKERAGKKRDAEAMYAVPSRGMPVAPKGAGDRDDFDAGWELHQ